MIRDKDFYFKKLKLLIKNSYAPYSHFRVASLVLSDGGVFSGVNVENCAFSPTICAERSAVSAMVTAGFKKILCVYILTDAPSELGTPCGLCRQVLSEFADPDVSIVTYDMSGEKNTYTVKQLLPFGFSKNYFQRN